MKKNINTKTYWDKRFSSTDWEDKNGRKQTKDFTKSQIKYLNLDKNFNGNITDFGCGLGDSMPVLRNKFSKAKLIGIDLSTEAIKKCELKYGHLATFIAGDHNAVPESNVIISSNVFEHLSNDKSIAKTLKEKCDLLIIIVPFEENLDNDNLGEHINTYNINSFSQFSNYTTTIFASKGWSEYGLNLWYNIWLKNIFKAILGKPLRRRRMQIMYQIKS